MAGKIKYIVSKVWPRNTVVERLKKQLVDAHMHLFVWDRYYHYHHLLLLISFFDGDCQPLPLASSAAVKKAQWSLEQKKTNGPQNEPPLLYLVLY